MDGPPNSNASEVIAWAQKFNISSYQKLLDAGFDVMYVLHTITEKDLDDIGITLAGEKRKILFAISRLPPPTTATTTNSSTTTITTSSLQNAPTLAPIAIQALATSPSSSSTPQVVYTTSTYSQPPHSPASTLKLQEEKKKRAPPHCLVCHQINPKRAHICAGECESFQLCGYERGHKDQKTQKEDGEIKSNKDGKEMSKEAAERKAIKDRLLYVESLPDCEKYKVQRFPQILKEREEELKQFATPEQRQEEAKRVAYAEWQNKRVRWLASKDMKKSLGNDKARLEELIDAQLSIDKGEGSPASNALQTLNSLQSLQPPSPSLIPINPPGPITTTIITHSTNGDLAEDWNWIQAGGAKELKKEPGRKQTWFCKSKKETGCDARKTVIQRPTGTVEIFLVNPHNHPKPPVKKKPLTTLVRTETTTQSIQHIQSVQHSPPTALIELAPQPTLHSTPLILPNPNANANTSTSTNQGAV